MTSTALGASAGEGTVKRAVMLHIPENNTTITTTKSAENVRWMFLDSPSAVRNTLSATLRGKGAVKSWEQAGQARSFLKSLMQTATYALLDHPLRYEVAGTLH